MAYASARQRRYGYEIGTGRSIAGVIGFFASFGVALALLAFASAYAFAEAAADPDVQTAVETAGGITVLAVGIVPIVGALILSTACGAWAGTRTRSGGRGAIAGAVGALAGVLALFVIVGIGFALGAAASGLDVATIQAPQGFVSPQLADNLQFLVSASGVVYLAANVVAAGLAGAIAGSVTPAYGGRSATEEGVVRGPSRAT